MTNETERKETERKTSQNQCENFLSMIEEDCLPKMEEHQLVDLKNQLCHLYQKYSN